MKESVHSALLFLLVFGLSLYCRAATVEAQVSGDLRFHTLKSKIFANERTVRVWLPPGFSEDLPEAYPVLYLNDGQNLFDPRTSSFSDREWQADETATALIQRGEIPALIVVGIDHPGNRLRPFEYLPWEDIFLHPPEPNPRGKDYPQFLLEEVLPFVERRYPVRTDPAGRVLGGSSYGALVSLFTIITRPGSFEGLLAESPSFYVDEARILRESRQHDVWPARVYLGVGTHEGRSSCREEENQEAVEDVRRLEKIIRENSHGTRLKVVVEQCGLHNEENYARRLPEALRFLFGSQGSRSRK